MDWPMRTDNLIFNFFCNFSKHFKDSNVIELISLGLSVKNLSSSALKLKLVLLTPPSPPHVSHEH